MKVVESVRRRRRIQWAVGAVAVAAIASFMFLGGTELFDSRNDTQTLPPASGGGASSDPTPGSTPASPGPVPTLEVWFTKGETLYSNAYAGNEGHVSVAFAALGRVVEGPSPTEEGAGLETQIPSGVVLNGVNIAGGIATVDLSEEFESGGGSLSMRMRVAQVIYTLTQLPGVDGVLFEIDGEPVDSIGGEGIDVSTPQTRKDYEDLLSPIVVTAPGIGGIFASGDIIEGTANVFEANVSWRILDENGDEIASGFTTATCGTGCRGHYTIEAEFSVDHDQEGTIEVLEYSAENGEPINVVSIPVTLLSD